LANSISKTLQVDKTIASLRKFGGDAAKWSKEAVKHVGKAAVAGFMATWKGIESVGNDIAWVGEQFAKGVMAAVEFIISLFACLGTFSDGWTTGYAYGMKDDCGIEAQYNPACCANPADACCTTSNAAKAACAGRGPTFLGWSVGISATVTGYIQYAIGILKSKPTGQLKLGIGIVFGFCPGTADTGGVRLGIGIGATLACGVAAGEAGCSLGIAIGFTGSALIPTPGGAGCPGPPALYLPGGLTPVGFKFGCSVAYCVAVTVMCCSLELVSGKEDCR
jgi:hypothetical protein